MMTIVKLKSFNIMLKITLPEYARGFGNAHSKLRIFPAIELSRVKLASEP